MPPPQIFAAGRRGDRHRRAAAVRPQRDVGRPESRASPAGTDLDPDLAVNARLLFDQRRALRRLALGGSFGEDPLDLFVGQALHPWLGGKGRGGEGARQDQQGRQNLHLVSILGDVLGAPAFRAAERVAIATLRSDIGAMVPFSILDLAPVAEGSDVGTALRNARSLAQAGERLGYRRFWMAEHHSMRGIASAATAV